MLKDEVKLTRILFLFLMLVNLLVRFNGLGDFSFSNDELSAIVRLEFDDMGTLLNEGVVKTDPHPAGVQVFLYYWTKIFGLSEFTVRFPFALAALFSIVFLFLTFRDWFGNKAALLGISLYSLMEFTIVHGQLARPYAMGILFVSMLLWSWSKILYSSQKRRRYLLLYLLSGTLACYTHYYSALLCAFIGLAGLIPARRTEQLKLYLLLNAAVVLLVLPHLSITIQQLSRGELTSWIPGPNKDFIWNHLFVLLNEDIPMVFVFGLMLIAGIYIRIKRGGEKRKFMYISLLFFAAPIIAGYVYSLFKGAALMDRVLYFSSPFIFIIAFSWLSRIHIREYIAYFFILIVAGLGSTYFNTGFADRLYVENFKGLAADLEELKKEDPYAFVFSNFNSPRYLEHYLKKPVDFEMNRIRDDKDLAWLMKSVRESKAERFALFWACTYQPIAALEYARKYFPKAEEVNIYYNSASWIFKRVEVGRDTLLFKPYWKERTLESNEEYLDLLKISNRALSDGQVLNISGKFDAEEVGDLMLVVETKSYYEEENEWRGYRLSDFIVEEGMNEFFASFKVRPLLHESDEIAIYFWNVSGDEVTLQNVQIISFADSAYPSLY